VLVSGLLVALAGVTPDAALLAAAARVLRSHAVAIHPTVRPLVDTCGTGGDGLSTFNISTAAAMAVAAAGAAVAKHGNRGVSSPVGSADVLEAAGCAVSLVPEAARTLLDATGFAFLFAPVFHPAMAHVAGVRRTLGIRTIFNLLGPLTNPALAEHQLVGVFDPKLTSVMAGALKELGSRGAMVVHCDGLDEIGLHAVTTGHRLKDGEIEALRIDPEALGLARAPLEALRGPLDAAGNCELLKRSLAGDAGPLSDVVALNAAAALQVAGRVDTLLQGLEQVRERMRSGAALRVLDRYAESSRRLAGGHR
ncbi:MAG: anthranilate phosphoribosyltransferase, partial [Planctomycetota bacterium]